jgi:hypothetical protein
MPNHLFKFSEEEINSATPEIMKSLRPKEDKD